MDLSHSPRPGSCPGSYDSAPACKPTAKGAQSDGASGDSFRRLASCCSGGGGRSSASLRTWGTVTEVLSSRCGLRSRSPCASGRPHVALTSSWSALSGHCCYACSTPAFPKRSFLLLSSHFLDASAPFPLLFLPNFAPTPALSHLPASPRPHPPTLSRLAAAQP